MNIHTPSHRLSGALAVSLALAALAAVPCAVFAQSMGMPPPQQMPEPMPMPGQQSDAAKSRGLFLAMFAQQVVPGLVSGIDAWFRNKLNVPMQGGPGANLQAGSMAGNNLSAQMPGMQGMQGMPGMQPQPGPGGWSPPGQLPPGQFSGNPGQPQMDGQQGMPQMPQQMPPMNQQMPQMPQQMPQQMPSMGQPPQMPMQGMPPLNGMPPLQQQPQNMMGDSGPLQAGVAYQVSLVDRDGVQTLVDPAQRAFGTGERIAVAYRTNLPGMVEVYNIDSTGREELIDQQQMSAGQLANLGPYEFVNVKGEETLRILLRPCVGGGTNPGTRGMVRAQVNPELGHRLLSCDDPSMRQPQRVASRGIAKVQLEGGTNFALDPVSRSEMESGRLAPREVRIRFLHR